MQAGMAEFTVNYNQHSGCKSLETETMAYEFVRDDLIFVQMDLNSVIPAALKKSYEGKKDLEGKKCLDLIGKKLNDTVESFRSNVLDIQYQKEMLNEYLFDSKTASRRNAGGIAVAIGLLDMVATGATFFYNDYRIKALQTKLADMNEYLSKINDERTHFVNNQEYLFKEGEIMGLHRDLITNQLNKLSFVHSCDVLYLNFDLEMIKLESTLNRIVQALLSGRLTTDIIDLDTVSKLTFRPYFYDSIYNISPNHLYSLSKLSLHSHEGNKLTFMVAYPYISRNQEWKRVNVLETSHKLLINRNDISRHVHFLLPSNVSIDNFTMSQVRNGENCFKNSNLLVCEPNSVLTAHSMSCLKSIILNESSKNCFTESTKSDFSFDYGSNGILIETKKGGKLLNLTTGRTIKDFFGHGCIYVEKKRDLGFSSNGFKMELFPESMLLKSKLFFRKNILKFHSKVVKNFTLPTVNNPISFRNISFMEPESFLNVLSQPLIATCLIVITIGCMTFCIIGYLCISKCCKQTQSNVNLNFRHGIDGSSLNR